MPQIGQDQPRVRKAAKRWMVWYESFVAEPDGDEAWQGNRLEHVFVVSAKTEAGPVVLTCEEYSEGRLDWYAFDAGSWSSLGDPPAEAVPERVVRTVMPTPVRYRGKPADRFWQFEDAEVSFGALAAGPTGLARLLLVELALIYGNDWFVIPVDLPVGSLCRITALEVTDTFGEVTTVGPSRDVPRRGGQHGVGRGAGGGTDRRRGLALQGVPASRRGGGPADHGRRHR